MKERIITMAEILFPRGRYPTTKIRKTILDQFSNLLESEDVRIIQRLELYDYVQYLLITNDLTKIDIELIITKRKFKGFIPGKSFPSFVKEKKVCTCSSLDFFRNNCTCGAAE